MKIKRTIREDLSPEKAQEYHSDVLDILSRIDQLEEELATVKSQFKNTIKEQELLLSDRRRSLRQGYEMVDVECDEQMNWDEEVVEIVRCDTGEVLDTRPITEEERQMNIDATVPDDDDEEEPPPEE